MDTSHPELPARFAFKRLLQLGSAAAALASIVGLFFTVGDQARGLFAAGGPAQDIRLERIALARMPLARYLRTREDRQQLTGLGFTPHDFRRKGVAVDFDLGFHNWAEGSKFQVRLLLDSRDAAGRRSFDEKDVGETLNAPSDHCVCHAFFFLPKHARRGRVTVRVFRANAAHSQPLRIMKSRWARWVSAA